MSERKVSYKMKKTFNLEAKTSCLGIFRLEFKKKPLLCFKSSPSNFSKCNSEKKIGGLTYGTKNALFCYL